MNNSRDYTKFIWFIESNVSFTNEEYLYLDRIKNDREYFKNIIITNKILELLGSNNMCKIINMKKILKDRSSLLDSFLDIYDTVAFLIAIDADNQYHKLPNPILNMSKLYKEYENYLIEEWNNRLKYISLHN